MRRKQMTSRELIEKLKQYPDAYVYVNHEPNIEDEFVVAKSDTDNILLVPIADLKELKICQEFSVEEF